MALSSHSFHSPGAEKTLFLSFPTKAAYRGPKGKAGGPEPGTLRGEQGLTVRETAAQGITEENFQKPPNPQFLVFEVAEEFLPRPSLNKAEGNVTKSA